MKMVPTVRIWRRMYDTEKQLATDGLRFMKEQVENDVPAGWLDRTDRFSSEVAQEFSKTMRTEPLQHRVSMFARTGKERPRGHHDVQDSNG
jgi:hypothetical protein